jgi:hypothetical protein
MGGNKDRLQLGIFARSRPSGTFNLALFITPKDLTDPDPNSSGIWKFSSKRSSSAKAAVTAAAAANDDDDAAKPAPVPAPAPQQWVFEAKKVDDLAKESRLLALICIGKVLCSVDKVKALLEQIPVAAAAASAADDNDRTKLTDGFHSDEWVQLAIKTLRDESAVSRVSDWMHIRSQAFSFVQMEKAKGRYDAGWKGASGIACMDVCMY